MSIVRIGMPDPPPSQSSQQQQQQPYQADLNLARAVLAKDRKATAELVDKLTGPVYNYVRSRLFPRTDLVDDVVQDILVACWQYLPGYRGASPLTAWILGIARHKVEDHYRRRLRQHEQWWEPDAGGESAPEPADTAAPPVDETIDAARRSARTRAVLEALPEQYATVLLWRYWEHRGSREIAEAIGRTEKAVERLLARARENFKKKWEDEERRHRHG